MAKSEIIHTLESLFACCDEVGTCLEWTGRFNNKTPSVYVNGTYVPARRLVMKLAGHEFPKNHLFGTSCGNWRCICQSHILARSRSEQASHMATKVNYSGPQRLAKIQMAARSRAIITKEQAMMVLVDQRPASEAAAQFNISKSLVYRIRSGKAWRNTSSPWAGLLGIS